ncbi:MAG: 4Fe-4S binding protein [Desulfobacteraceae bacterium]|nr:MAG: 4Fe-4S binding protein [Desulfobacteraceae bacterium]
MNIILTRRISQIFFMTLFLWFCLAATLGEQWWQLQGWPVNWFLQLDPLVGIGTFLTTHTLFRGLAWCTATLVLTILLGRFFCGWVCPFGALHQFVGYLGKQKNKAAEKIRKNQYRKAQYLKYWILIFLLTAAASKSINLVQASAMGSPGFFTGMLVLAIMILLISASVNHMTDSAKTVVLFSTGIVMWMAGTGLLNMNGMFLDSLQTGLLDPIPLFQRSVNLVLLPLMDKASLLSSTNARYYEQGWLIGGIFLTAVLLNLAIPRFYCRFICPLGALFGLVSRYSIRRIGQKPGKCTHCKTCEVNCEGACEPSRQIRINECVLCMNCLHCCPDDLMEYSLSPSVAGEIHAPDLQRRDLIVSAVSGLALVPLLRLGGTTGPNWNPALIRPPGALDEESFLARCIKCGQCMRICPTNIIQPAGFTFGIEELWTPRLNFRIGTSGCQLNCIACANLCPTAAIRPISLAEKLGKGDFSTQGPVRIGTAFVDRSRCLPWAMKKPCIVCQENCPVSPKAIYTEVSHEKIRLDRPLIVDTGTTGSLTIRAGNLPPGKYATGDYFVHIPSHQNDGYRRIVQNSADFIQIADDPSWEIPPEPGSVVEIFVRLQKPFVHPETCIGCGTCEHECPVSGKRAIRITAENESRNREHTLLL